MNEAKLSCSSEYALYSVLASSTALYVPSSGNATGSSVRFTILRGIIGTRSIYALRKKNVLVILYIPLFRTKVAQYLYAITAGGRTFSTGALSHNGCFELYPFV